MQRRFYEASTSFGDIGLWGGLLAASSSFASYCSNASRWTYYGEVNSSYLLGKCVDNFSGPFEARVYLGNGDPTQYQYYMCPNSCGDTDGYHKKNPHNLTNMPGFPNGGDINLGNFTLLATMYNFHAYGIWVPAWAKATSCTDPTRWYQNNTNIFLGAGSLCLSTSGALWSFNVSQKILYRNNEYVYTAAQNITNGAQAYQAYLNKHSSQQYKKQHKARRNFMPGVR